MSSHSSRRSSGLLGPPSQMQPPMSPTSTSSSTAQPTQVALRSQAASPSGSVTEAMQSISLAPSLERPSFPLRPSFGKIGISVPALTNHFKVDPSQMTDIDEYDSQVRDIENNIVLFDGFTKRRVFYILFKTHSEFRYACTDYAGKIYSSVDHKLTDGQYSPKVYHVVYYDEAQQCISSEKQVTHKVRLCFRRPLPISPFLRYLSNPGAGFPDLEKYLLVLDMMVSRWPKQMQNMITLAQGAKIARIDRQNGRRDLGGGLEVYPAYFRSVRNSLSGLVLNLNTTAAAFFEEIRADHLIGKLPFTSPVADYIAQAKELSLKLKGVRVSTRYSGLRARTITGVAIPSQPNLSPTGTNIAFLNDQNESVTVNEYFAQRYPNTVRPNSSAWVLILGMAGDRPIYVPSDLCLVLPGQHFNHLITDPKQSANMIKWACRKPSINRDMILDEGLRHLGIGQNGGPHHRFNLTANHQMMRIDARTLPAPELSYKNGKDASAQSGSWNLRKKKFLRPPHPNMIKYAFIQFVFGKQSGITNFKEFVKEINEAVPKYCDLPNSGPLLPFSEEQATHQWPQGERKDVLKSLENILGQLVRKGVRLVFVILPDYSASNYAAIKTVADVKVGIHTICTVQNGRKVKTRDGEVANLMLKFNMKLGGLNHGVQFPALYKDILTKDTMIVGLDVTHPGEAAMTKCPSIAGLAATFGQDFFQYAGYFRCQRQLNDTKQAVEMILHLKDMMVDALRFWQARNNGRLPRVIIVYRDGVSEGQFSLVLVEELPRIKEALKQVYLSDSQEIPKIAICIVQKRHHARFYQCNPKQGFDTKGNPLPGFVVDSQITSEKYWDWYNASHVCLQGTTRPSKYIIVHDELGVNADKIQLMTHQMCWLFGRATKSISIHPAARYADMICQRARCYMYEAFTGGKSNVYDPKTDPFCNARVHIHLRSSMFYS